MNDSADMAPGSGSAPERGVAQVSGSASGLDAAAARLSSALDRLESRIGTLAGTSAQARRQRDQLQQKLAQAESFVADRAELAARLDRVTAEARAKNDALAAREREFDTLARRTEDEIAAIAKQVETALDTNGSA